MAKPVLFYAIINKSLQRFAHGTTNYEILAVTKETEAQISGVREGDIGGVTFNKRDLLAKHPTLEAAKIAILAAENVRKSYHINIRDAENVLKNVKQARDLHVSQSLAGKAQ